MRGAIVAGGLALLCASPAAAQTVAGEWKLTVDSARDLTLATFASAGGQGLAVRCQAGVLDVLALGLPAFPSATRYMETTYGVRAPEAAHWFSSPDGALAYSPTPAMTARRLREGGRLEVSAAVAPDETSALRRYAVDLPSDAAAVDRALAACGEPLTKARDALSLWRQPRVMAPSMWRRPPNPEVPEAAYATTTRIGFAVLSCVVTEDGRPVDCDVEYQSDRRTGFGSSAIRAMRTARVDMDKASAPRPGDLMVVTLRYQF
jgi:TonB family protein